MENAHPLNVWYQQMLVGVLWRDHAGNIGFRYEKSWLEHGFAISQQLPLSGNEHTPAEGRAHQFFVNLLPEAAARTHIVRDLKIADSDFELLSAIGGECAGALSILPEAYSPNKVASYQRLSNDVLKKLLRRKGNLYNLTSEDARPRLSLAGAQDKCPVFYDGEHYFLPQDAAPSTHILKFELLDYRHIPVYEYFLSCLAAEIRLPTVTCQLEKIDQDYFLLIERYDRVVIHGNVQRLHQEDFCQALGVAYQRKYQQDGGPTFVDCYQLIQKISANPIRDNENLLKWQIFNVLAGNSDGHAKNLAILYDDKQRASLAPFYDLVCTRAIDRIDNRLAMSVGGKFNPGDITWVQWEALAKACDIRPQYLRKLLQEMAELLQEGVVKKEKDFQNAWGPYPALQRVVQVVTKQCGRMLKQLK